MAEEIFEPAVRYLVQMRVVSEKKIGPWRRAPTLYKTPYEAIQFRDETEQFLVLKKHGNKFEDEIMDFVRGMLGALDGKFEIRIIKRTITDEIFESAEAIKHNG